MVAGSAAIRGRCRRTSCGSSGTSRCRHKPHFALGASICGYEPSEVRRCTAVDCPAWPFRMGKSPWKAERVLSERQREALRERGRALAARINSGVVPQST
jgi:hypothetical protein